MPVKAATMFSCRPLRLAFVGALAFLVTGCGVAQSVRDLSPFGGRETPLPGERQEVQLSGQDMRQTSRNGAQSRCRLHLQTSIGHSPVASPQTLWVIWPIRAVYPPPGALISDKSAGEADRRRRRLLCIKAAFSRLIPAQTLPDLTPLRAARFGAFP